MFSIVTCTNALRAAARKRHSVLRVRVVPTDVSMYGDAVRDFFDALSENGHLLYELSLTRLRLGMRGCEGLAQALVAIGTTRARHAAQPHSVVELRAHQHPDGHGVMMHHVSVDTSVGVEAAQEARASHNVFELILTEALGQAAEFFVVVRALRAVPPFVTRLDVAGNRLGDIAFEFLCEQSVGWLSKCEFLNVADNELGAASTARLVRILPQLERLQVLNIHNNPFLRDSKSICALCVALSDYTRIPGVANLVNVIGRAPYQLLEKYVSGNQTIMHTRIQGVDAASDRAIGNMMMLNARLEGVCTGARGDLWFSGLKIEARDRVARERMRAQNALAYWRARAVAAESALAARECAR